MAEFPEPKARLSPGIRRSLLAYVQYPLLAAFVVVVLISTQSPNPSVFRETVICTVALVALTVAANVVPWRRLPPTWLMSIAILDIVVIGFLREAALAENLGLNILVLIPVLWLCYSFDGYAVTAALVGIAFVAVFPFVQSQTWPNTLMLWGNAALLPAVVAMVAVAVHVAAKSLRRQQERLTLAYERLRVSVAQGKVGEEALRVSVAEGAMGQEALRLSVAEGVVGAEALRVAVAQGLTDSEALRVSVAEGLEGAEALRVSVARALDAASAALAVVDTVDAGITLYDVHGVVVLTNDTARDLAFFDADVSSSEASSPVIFGADRLTPIPAIDQIVARAARGELVTRRAYWMGEGNEQRALMATSQFVKRASGELIGTVVATHDVTPLAAAIRSRDEFLTTVSHELRTPLTNVIGYLELIEDGIDIAHLGIASEFGIVQRNTHRLLGLINDLLTTAEGQASLERRPFDVAELVTNALNTIRPAAAERRIRVVTPLILPVVAEIDADRIADVLDKLLSNALKFNRDGGAISVTVESRGTDAVVRISDTGIGIAPADLRRIFERFFRSSTVREGEVAGSGLGLSTAKVIVDSHLGTMTAESVVDEGTTIELRLPVTVNVAAAKSASASTAGWTLG
jgi:signal transduction histidine kinase